MSVRARIATLVLVALAACGGDDLGECDQEAAEQPVFGRGGLVATKGQALVHDSCGQGAFCHSASARGDLRMGAPAGLDFDMLPAASGWPAVVERREEIWDAVQDGSMPPDGHTAGDGDWSFDRARDADGARLPALATREGKGALRNWLACNAPIVVETRQPEPPAPEPDADMAELEQQWTQLHGALQQTCVTGACHNAAMLQQLGGAGQALPFEADECVVYRWLLWDDGGNCAQPFVVAGRPDESSLVWKMEHDSRICGGPMPPDAEVDEPLVADVRDWIERGAFAPQCGVWSDDVARTHVAPGQDGGAGEGPDPASWTQLHSDVIVPRCAFGGCHAGASAAAAGGLDLQDPCGARAALLETGACGEPRVRPGDADSLLLDKIDSGDPRCGMPMPPPSGGLPASAVERMRQWVVAGAEAPDCE